MPRYRVEFSVQQCEDGEDDFTEIGFGSSGSWDDLEAAAHMTHTMLQTQDWETAPGMPEPRHADR